MQLQHTVIDCWADRYTDWGMGVGGDISEGHTPLVHIPTPTVKVLMRPAFLSRYRMLP